MDPHTKRDSDQDTPHASRTKDEGGKPDQLNEDKRQCESRQEALLDEGIEETFPASDPVSAKRIT